MGAIQRTIDILKPDVLIEGECRGADSIARDYAFLCFIPVEPYPADWDGLGKKAGPIRNRRMLDEGHPDVVVGFAKDLPRSIGTMGMLSLAESRGINCIHHDGAKVAWIGHTEGGVRSDIWLRCGNLFDKENNRD